MFQVRSTECFETEDEAQAFADKVTTPNHTFVIEEIKSPPNGD